MNVYQLDAFSTPKFPLAEITQRVALTMSQAPNTIAKPVKLAAKNPLARFIDSSLPDEITYIKPATKIPTAATVIRSPDPKSIRFFIPTIKSHRVQALAWSLPLPQVISLSAARATKGIIVKNETTKNENIFFIFAW